MSSNKLLRLKKKFKRSPADTREGFIRRHYLDLCYLLSALKTFTVLFVGSVVPFVGPFGILFSQD